MGLRNKLVRLAYQKPELRGVLLPMLSKEAFATPLYLLPGGGRAQYMGTYEFLVRLNDEYGRAIPKAYALVGRTLKSFQKDWEVDLSRESAEFEQISKLGIKAANEYAKAIEEAHSIGEEARKEAEKAGKLAFNIPALGGLLIFNGAKALVKILGKTLRYGKGSVAAASVKSFLERSRSILWDNIDSQEDTLLAALKKYPTLLGKVSAAIGYQKQMLKKIEGLQKTLPPKLKETVVY